MNRQSCHFVKEIFSGGYFLDLVVPCTPLSRASQLSLPCHPLALRFLSQAVFVWQLCLWTTGKVDCGFVLLVAVDVLEVYHHMQGIG